MSKSENRKRTILIPIRVLPEENDIITTNAKNAGYVDKAGNVSRQKYMLDISLKRKINPPQINREGAFAISEQLRKIGINLNQLTRNVHMGYIDDCSKELSDLYNIMQEVYRELIKSQTN